QVNAVLFGSGPACPGQPLRDRTPRADELTAFRGSPPPHAPLRDGAPVASDRARAPRRGARGPRPLREEGGGECPLVAPGVSRRPGTAGAHGAGPARGER